MATSFRKKIFLLVFCLASIMQGMYSTYFVSILTTIERIYQIQSKTAGAILSATEIGQIMGSLFIAYYGGRGNKPKWISVCMTLSAFAALISISPHFILLATNDDTIINQQTSTAMSSSLSSVTAMPYLISDLTSTTNPVDQQQVRNASSVAAHSKLELPSFDQLCRIGNSTQELTSLNITHTIGASGTSMIADTTGTASEHPSHGKHAFPVTLVIAIFSICLLAIGFGSTAITTLGIPFIDDIISREESPLYLGLTIGLRIFGPALGFLLGSFCIRLNANSVISNGNVMNNQFGHEFQDDKELGAWWLGLIIISLPLLILAMPMYFLSRVITSGDSEKDDYEDITYQAAEDHDIGGSHDFPAHVLGLAGDLDVTSSRTCFSSQVDSSSREVLRICRGSGVHDGYNPDANHYDQNIAFDQPILSANSIRMDKTNPEITSIGLQNNEIDDRSALNEGISEWRAPNVRLVVNHLDSLEATGFTNDIDETGHQQRQTKVWNRQQQQGHEVSPSCVPQASTRSSIASTISSSSYIDGKSKHRRRQQQQQPQAPQLQQEKSTMGDLSSSLSRLLKNRLLVLRMLSGVLHILPIAGFYTFLPKYLIEQFRVTSSSASAISGLAGILFVGFGAFIGGTIIRVFNVNSRLMTRWIATSALLYALGMILLMNLDCEQNQIVHFNSQEFVSTDCSLSCKCSRATYNPVCANGTTFASPCLAGCKGHTITEGRVIFDECGCKPFKNGNLSLVSGLSDTVGATHINLNVATQGQCSNNCDNIIWYVILFSIFTFVHASCEVGSMMFNLRCVKSNDRTLALGLITFSSSLLGTIPCSIIYGSIVDFTCVHWDTYATSASSLMTTEATARGACRAYDNDSFRYYLHGLTAMVMSLAFIVDCIICSRSNEVDFYEGPDESKIDIRIGLKKSTETMQ